MVRFLVNQHSLDSITDFKEHAHPAHLFPFSLSPAQVFHPPETEDWFLEISSVTFRDSGVYECQVSTSPKVSLPIHLTVLGQFSAFTTLRVVCVLDGKRVCVLSQAWIRGSDICSNTCLDTCLSLFSYIG